MREILQQELNHQIDIITPEEVDQSGAQLSIIVKGDVDGKSIFDTIESNGVTCDFRHPNVIRVAPVALYNSYTDAYHFVTILKEALA
jgi:kynureninase